MTLDNINGMDITKIKRYKTRIKVYMTNRLTKTKKFMTIIRHKKSLNVFRQCIWQLQGTSFKTRNLKDGICLWCYMFKKMG